MEADDEVSVMLHTVDEDSGDEDFANNDIDTQRVYEEINTNMVNLTNDMQRML